MAIITLTSDWGTSDYYLAAVKGTILSQFPEVTLVDISHHIRQFDIEGAAFTVRNCFENFPKGTIHIVAVNTEESIEHPHVAISHKGHFFIGTDNGLFSMILGGEPEAAVEIDIPQDSGFFTFSTRDRFAKAAIQLLRGTPLSDLGETRTQLTSRILFKPATTDDSIKGMVMHIDAYGNAITNIPFQLFSQLKKGRAFEIYFSGYRIRKIEEGYMDVGIADLLAVFGTHGMLEIAMNQANAASLCGLERYTPVSIRFE